MSNLAYVYLSYYRRVAGESVFEDLVSENISNILKNEFLFQKTEQILKSLNKGNRKEIHK